MIMLFLPHMSQKPRYRCGDDSVKIPSSAMRFILPLPSVSLTVMGLEVSVSACVARARS